MSHYVMSGNRQLITAQPGGLNLTMDELTHSAFDLTSGVTRSAKG